MTDTNPAIEVQNVTRRFGDVLALDDVSLSIEANTISALLGANGAGKTTLMSILAGHDRPTSGSVRVGGELPFESSSVAAASSFIRDNQRYPDNYFLHHALRSAALFHDAWDAEYAGELTRVFRLPAKTQIQKFSRGQLSALAIVISLASRAPMTIFDEPYLGLDVAARNRFYELLIEDFTAHPRTVIVSTHLVGEMENLFNQAVILDQGKVVLDAPVDDLRAGAYALSGPHDAVHRLAAGDHILQSRQLGALATAIVRGDYIAAKNEANGHESLNISPVSLQDLVAAIGGDSHKEAAA